MSNSNPEKDHKTIRIVSIQRTAKERTEEEEPAHNICPDMPITDPILTPEEEKEWEEWLRFEAWRVGLNE